MLRFSHGSVYCWQAQDWCYSTGVAGMLTLYGRVFLGMYGISTHGCSFGFCSKDPGYVNTNRHDLQNMKDDVSHILPFSLSNLMLTIVTISGFERTKRGLVLEELISLNLFLYYLGASNED